MTKRAAIYCRISADREGREVGVQRQEEDCRALAARLGYESAQVYVDNDISASTLSKKPRPRYAAMVEAVRLGRHDAILSYSNSRLTRRPLEWIELINLANAGKVVIKTVVSGEHDLSTADGRAVAMTIAVWDGAEAERTAERVKRAKAQAVKEGRYRGGPRPFGYESDGVTLRPVEAALVRQAVRGVIEGRSLIALAREFNEAGAVGSRGAAFNAMRVRRVIQRARNAGLIEVGGEVVGRAEWPAIVTEDEWRAAMTVLADPARRTSTGPERRHLLSGIARCGICDARMIASKSRNHGMYKCAVSTHVTRHQATVDEYVTGIVKALVTDPRIVDRLNPERDGATNGEDVVAAEALRNRLKVYEADYRAGHITGRQLREFTASTEAEVAVIEARIASRMRGTVLDGVADSADPSAAFDASTLDRKRAIIGALVTVKINKGRRGRPAGWRPGDPYVDLSSVLVDPIV